MFWTVVLEKTLESSLDYKEIQPIHPKEDESWIFLGRTDAEGEAPILWPPDAKKWLTRKDPDAGKDWRQKEKGTTEDEMVGWHQTTWWTWVWVSSGSWWWTGKPGMLQSMELQSWTQLSDWTELKASSELGLLVVHSLNPVWLFATHGLQHSRPPCSSPTSRVYSNSCPLSWWCHPPISSSVVLSSSHLQSFPASGSFQMSQFFASGGKVLEFQLQHHSFQWIFRTDFL